MGYVEKHLIENEKIIYKAQLHWIIFFTLKALLTLFLAPLMVKMTSEYTITNRRVIIKTGFISRQTFEMNLSRIESVEVDQSFWGRILGYGSITIIGTGGTRELFNNISDPLKFRKVFQQLV
jgi:uncharacterized membrane protein YdbT with pleckstrin-like domain